jgi:hypothetical protein
MCFKIKAVIIGLLLSANVYSQSKNSFYVLEDIETNDDSIGDIYLHNNSEFTFNYAYVNTKKNLTIKKVKFARYAAGNELLVNNLKLINTTYDDGIKQIYTSKADDGPLLITVIIDTMTNTFDIELYNVKYEQYVTLYYKLQ